MKILVKGFTFASTLLAVTMAVAQTIGGNTPPAMPENKPPAPKWCTEVFWLEGQPKQEEGKALVGYFTFSLSAYIARKDFDGLRMMFDQVNDPKCLFADGRPRLSTIPLGFIYYFSNVPDWAKSREAVEEVKKAMPKEPIAALFEAQYWISYAWSARGSGYSSSVSQEGWKLFKERLAQAEKVLTESKDYASSSPLWYDLMLVAKSAGGGPESERDAVFAEGVDKYDWYLPLYFTRQSFLTPWWGGDWDRIESFALWSVKKTKKTMGETMYARLYWSVAGNDYQVNNVFKESKASWPKMKKGFDDLMKRFPESRRNLNAYARFACTADDRQTYLRLRKLIGNDITEDTWSSHRRPEVCDAKFGYKS